MQTLYVNQTKAVEKLCRLTVGANFSEAGTGKTLSTVGLIETTNCDRVLWVTPFATKANLADELLKWNAMQGKQVRIVGAETLSSSDSTYLQLLEWVTQGITFMVVDESLKIKNSDAKRTKRIIAIGKRCAYRVIMNGTPITRSILDLWAQMEFLSPKILNMTERRFKRNYVEWIEERGIQSGRNYKKEKVVAWHNLEHLYSLIEPYVFECSLDIDIDSLRNVVKYSLTDEQHDTYREIKANFLRETTMEQFGNNVFMAMTTKMQHSYTCAPQKMRLLKDILDRHGCENVLVYTKFISPREMIKEHLPCVRVMSLQSDSFGLNLQQYNVIVGWDHTWDYANLIQRDRRIYRLGQGRTCHYYELQSDAKLDSMMWSNIQKKGRLLTQFKDVGYRKVAEQL